MESWDSPVLGESVSMYEGGSINQEQGQEDVEMMYENILGQVKRLLAQDQGLQHQSEGEQEHGQVVGSEQLPEQEYQQNVPVQAEVNHESGQNNLLRKVNLFPKLKSQNDTQPLNTLQRHFLPPVSSEQVVNSHDPQEFSAPTRSTTTATWDRLRQLGVSFISPSDLAPAPPPPAATSAPFNSVYLPQANIPSNTIFSPSPDTSLAINSLALKYLSDRELTKLATQHTGGGQPAPRPTDYSMASHQYMARYGLGQQESGVPNRAQENGVPQGAQGRVGTRPAIATPLRPNVEQNRHQNTPQVETPLQRGPQLAGLHRHIGPPQHVEPVQLQGRHSRPALAPPDIEGRVLDITAIRQQSKLL